MKVRGIRGATTVEHNDADEILAATAELLEEMVRLNHVDPDDIASVFITMSPDLNATFPARAIRTMSGWETVPLMCATEIDVPGGLARCIRLLMLVNTELSPRAIRHAYLKEARKLRPDLAGGEDLTDSAFSSNV
ncbi:chorismate mutase AroH [Marinithermofilum abyssi]|uniref:chorismate mutase n=1 Tax=Marinithermofilum abyssi TaxID=1571185 RepID=A0A8J2Y8Y1_9BACL|nr:chorismate mutase [Marinithermofilum abyssi]GGE11332.1 chorismate mutase AroH [Marinithermofilum abyssi]